MPQRHIRPVPKLAFENLEGPCAPLVRSFDERSVVKTSQIPLKPDQLNHNRRPVRPRHAIKKFGTATRSASSSGAGHSIGLGALMLRHTVYDWHG